MLAAVCDLSRAKINDKAAASFEVTNGGDLQLI